MLWRAMRRIREAFRYSASTASGGGAFSQEWITWKDLEKHLKKQSEAITSILRYPLFRGKSVNTPSFLLSVLKHEGLVVTMKGKRRQHELADPKPFLAEVKELMEAGTDLDPESKPSKTPVRKRASSSRRKTSPTKKWLGPLSFLRQ